MKALIQTLFPSDPPMPSMTFTRKPVVHLFWGGGLLAMAVGFFLGLVLMAGYQGVIEVQESFVFLKALHARIQMELFIGSFLLGFALQSGPHVVGGTPPPSHQLLKLLYLLWVGFGISLINVVWCVILGNVLISLAYGGASYFLFKITLMGDKTRRLSRGFPLAASFLVMALSPWLNLEHSEVALFVLWCGPITIFLVAGQQLIQNVLGGRLLQGGLMQLFFVLVVIAWIASGLAAFSAHGSWFLASLIWLMVLTVLMLGTGFLGAVVKSGLSAINTTLVLGFLSTLLGSLLPLFLRDTLAIDSMVHLLGAGVLTTLIIGVSVRVVGFFSGKSVLNDRFTVYLLLFWSVVVVVRIAQPMGWMGSQWTLGTIVLASVILMVWGVRLAGRLLYVGRQFP